jgi:hypothetical protein
MASTGPEPDELPFWGSSAPPVPSDELIRYALCSAGEEEAAVCSSDSEVSET